MYNLVYTSCKICLLIDNYQFCAAFSNKNIIMMMHLFLVDYFLLLLVLLNISYQTPKHKH